MSEVLVAIIVSAVLIGAGLALTEWRLGFGTDTHVGVGLGVALFVVTAVVVALAHRKSSDKR
jgi:hypothetical protein